MDKPTEISSNLDAELVVLIKNQPGGRTSFASSGIFRPSLARSFSAGNGLRGHILRPFRPAASLCIDSSSITYG